MKTKTPIVEKDAWWCETCKTSELTRKEAFKHLKTTHGLETKGLKGNKKLVTHMDGADWFSYQWEVTVLGNDGKEIKMTNSTLNERAKYDPMRFAK